MLRSSVQIHSNYYVCRQMHAVTNRTQRENRSLLGVEIESYILYRLNKNSAQQNSEIRVHGSFLLRF